MVKGTKADAVIKILNKIPLMQRKKVKEVTLMHKFPFVVSNLAVWVSGAISVAHFELKIFGLHPMKEIAKRKEIIFL